MTKKIVLASASPRRKQLLTQVGLNFTVESSNLEERIDNKNLDFGFIVTDLAYKKARGVACNHTDGIIIGADTIVVINESILGKPSSEHEAKLMLAKLSGRWHSVFTGLAVIDLDSKVVLTDFVESKVKFRKLSKSEIDNYVKTGEPLDKAGAYGIQEKGALLVEKINGCYYNIVGLPVFKLKEMLSKVGVEIL